MITFTLDGKEIQVPKGTTVYQAAKQQGIEIPIFCYHDRMPPFGACRMCLVQVEKMGKLQASCTLEAAEGMVVNTQHEKAVEGREEILELLLINHPLDCPICDRGGECPLQDNVLKYGPGLSRFFEEKRHFKKPIPLGPVLMLDRERCIACARCTRFSDELAGDSALTFLDRGYRTEVGTKGEAIHKAKFIGNTIMICPVGALTSQVYRFRARPWDNDTTVTTCTLCPVGCSMKLDTRDGEIMRTRSLENRAVNDIWLCDKGWFGYEFGENEGRLKTPLIRKNGFLVPSNWEEAIQLITAKIREARPEGKLAALGGNPLTLEENYLFQQLVRKGFGVPHIDHRVGMPIIPLDQEIAAPGMQMEIGDLEGMREIYLLGLDITEEFPVIWLRIRQALNKGAKIIYFGHFAPEISHLLSDLVIHPPGHELENLKAHLKAPNDAAFLIGSQYLASASRAEILSYLAGFASCSLNLLEGQDNSMGARKAGVRPDMGDTPGLDAPALVKTMAEGGWDLLYVAGSNPAVKFPSKLWQEAKDKLKFLVVQDLFLTETAKSADVVLPVLAYTEKKGTFMNIEGRLQPLMPGKPPYEQAHSDQEIFFRIAQKLGVPLSLDKDFPEQPLALKLSTAQRATPPKKENALFATFAPVLFDQGVRMQHNTRLKQLAKSRGCRIHPEEAKKRKLQDGAHVKITSDEGSIQTELQWDASVSLETLVIPLGFNHIRAQELSIHLLNGVQVELEEVK